MKTLLRVGLAASFGLAAVMAVGQVAKSGSGYLFRYKYAKGSVYRYQMVSSTLYAQKTIKVGLNFKITVLKVGKSSSTLKYDIDPMTINGQGSGQKQTADVKLDRQGNVIGDSAQIQQLGNVAYPTGPIAIGKSWARNVKSNVMGVKMNMAGTYTLTGFKNVRNKQYAEVAVKMVNSGDFSANGKGTMLIDTSDGTVYAYLMKMNLGMKTAQGPLNIGTTVTIDRK